MKQELEHDSPAGEDRSLKDNPKPIKVTLADDDQDDRECFEEALDETNIPSDLTTVQDSRELLENLYDKTIPNPDIIFIDINMPGKDGIECLNDIKKDETLREIPTVVYTTSTDPDDIEATFMAGANLFVPKPNSFANLVLLLKKIFRMRLKTLLNPLRKSFVLSEKNLGGKL